MHTKQNAKKVHVGGSVRVPNLSNVAIILDVIYTNFRRQIEIMKKIMIAAIFALALSAAAFADIARPDVKPKPVPKPKGPEADMIIRIDAGASEAKLVVPKTHLKKLRAELDELDQGDVDNTADAGTSIQRIQTIVGGVFLSLAFVFGGFWIVKRNGKGAAAAGIVAVMLTAGGAVSLVYANVGPPPSARKITSKIFDANVIRPYNFISGKIRVEVGNTETFELIVPDEGIETSNRK